MWNKKQITSQQRYHRKAHVFASLLICAIFLSTSPHDATAENMIASTKQSNPTKDIRILIDISGSMKKTDPNNFRRPAIKLFANLLPENVLAGVWTFGKWVNMLVPHGITDSKWKSIVHSKVLEINSAGLYTNIEEALQQATWDWKTYDPAYERTIIILSDGVVDISENPQINNDSRNRILHDILTTLRNARVNIHTIALSELSDKHLLQQLSSASGGIHETIETTEDLDKTFMRIFDIATPRDELPLIDNKVKVDSSIKEITFLTFRDDKSKNTIIISPSGKKYDNKKNSSDVIWHSEKRYDLVTIKTPETGVWSIDAAINPDNRAMIVTNLRLIANKLPDNILTDDKISFYAHLETDNKIITRREFLHFVRMSIKYSNKKNRYSIKLKDDGKGIDKNKKDGIYSAEIKKISGLGAHTFELSVNGTTFKRKNTQQINIVKHPVIIDIKKTQHNNILVSIIPYQSLIDMETLEITAIHSKSGKKIKNKKYSIEKINLSEWKTTIPTNDITGIHTITIKGTGNNQNGKKINFSTDPVDILIGTENQEKTDYHEETSNELTKETSEDKKTSWLNVIFSVIIFNVILVLICFSIYKLWIIYQYTLLPPPFEEINNARP